MHSKIKCKKIINLQIKLKKKSISYCLEEKKKFKLKYKKIKKLSNKFIKQKKRLLLLLLLKWQRIEKLGIKSTRILKRWPKEWKMNGMLNKPVRKTLFVKYENLRKSQFSGVKDSIQLKLEITDWWLRCLLQNLEND